MNEESKSLALLRENIEHIEMSYLKSLATGPGYPVFTIFDLDDPVAIEQARMVQPAEEIEDAMIRAEARGVRACLVYHQVLVNPYHVGQNWWKDTPPDRFPLGIFTDGQFHGIARKNPDGTDEALRRRLLLRQNGQVKQAIRDYDLQNARSMVVIVAELRDEIGVQAASAAIGADEVHRKLEIAGSASSVVMVVVGIPNVEPGEAVPPGQVPVQVAAYGGILDALVEVG